MRRALVLAALAVATGCATVPKDHSRLVAAHVRSILVVPVVNKSADVTAPDYFLSTVPIPVAERGYYVFPVNLVKRVLEDDGLADPGLVHGADAARLASIFGADAILYVTIERWDAQWLLVRTSVTVLATYVLKDGRTGEVLWSEQQETKYVSGGDNILVAIVAAAVERAAPKYMPLARQANARALLYPGGPGFPSGPYHPEHGKDWAPEAGPVAVASPAPAAGATPSAPPSTPPASPQ